MSVGEKSPNAFGQIPQVNELSGEAITDMGISPPGVSNDRNKLTKFPPIHASTDNRKKNFRIFKYQTMNIQSTHDETSPAMSLRPRLNRVIDNVT